MWWASSLFFQPFIRINSKKPSVQHLLYLSLVGSLYFETMVFMIWHNFVLEGETKLGTIFMLGRMVQGKFNCDILQIFFWHCCFLRSYFFSIECLTHLVAGAGLDVSSCHYVNRRTVNKKEGVDEPRVFVQGKFIKRCKYESLDRVKIFMMIQNYSWHLLWRNHVLALTDYFILLNCKWGC